MQHPQLMDVLLGLLRPDDHADSRRINEEALRVLGRLGALDPYVHREITSKNINPSTSSSDYLSINDMLVDYFRKMDRGQWMSKAGVINSH